MHLDDMDYRFVPDGTSIPNESAFQLVEDDLLFIRYNGSAELVGTCARVTAGAVGALYPDKLIRAVVDKNRADPFYLEIALNGGGSLEAIRERRKTTAGQVGIAGSQLLDVPVPLPPLDIQNNVARHVHAVMEAVGRGRAATEWARVRSQALRSSVLARAFAGQLAPQDSDDEPASILLDRISASRYGHQNRRSPAGAH
jgi:type I restriction enzyme S subunit